MNTWRTIAFIVGLPLAALGCSKSDHCNPPPRWDHQCADAAILWNEYYSHKYPGGGTQDAAAAEVGISDAGGINCPTAKQLQYEDVSPYSVDLMGDGFVSGPETGRTDNLCCYQTGVLCY